MNVNTSLPTNHTAHPPPAVPTPINIYQWIRSADGCYTPSADYVKCAVNLAWMLTKHLMDLLASGTIAITDIRVDTVIIYATISGQSTSIETVFNNEQLVHQVQGVQFRVDAPTSTQQHAHTHHTTHQSALVDGIMPINNINSRGQIPPHSPLTARAICAALGNIFLEIFSRGQSSARPGAAAAAASSSTADGSSSSIDLPIGKRSTGDAIADKMRASADIPRHGRLPRVNSDSSSDINSKYPASTDSDSIPSSSQRRKMLTDSSAMGIGGDTTGNFSQTVHAVLTEVGMPASVRRLVCNLMDAISEPHPDSGISSIEEVYWDLTQMKDDPTHFLFDRICPQKALEDTFLFQSMDRYMFGREKELSVLMDVKKRIAKHVLQGRGDPNMNNSNPNGKGKIEESLSFEEEIDFRCESIFLSGYAGAGKSTILHYLSRSCAADGWFVLNFKFDDKHVPLKVLANAFNELFEVWNLMNTGVQKTVEPDTKQRIEQVCRSISSTIDREGMSQLCEIIPNMVKLFPELASLAQSHCLDQGTSSSIECVGSATQRRLSLFHVLFKSLCGAGRPVLLTYDDLQWAKSMEGMKDFLINYLSVPCAIKKGSCNHGLFLLGSFRSNEVNRNDGIIKNITEVEHSKKVKVSGLVIDELEQVDITKLLAATLCLPCRYTRELAGLVHAKTRGNPFFVVQFLQSIVQNGMLEFSVQSRRWIWDFHTIDMQMISEGVAELLTTRFDQLPDYLMRTLKIASCFGSQVNISTVDILNAGQNDPFIREEVLDMAAKEGVLEKTGIVYRFTHDIIHQTIYESISQEERSLLHKNIGMNLLRSSANNQTIHILAVDQINIFIKNVGTLGSSSNSGLISEERLLFAKINATAAKFAIAASTFEQARSYVNVGLKMLDANHWQQQYSLSLDLYEMSASVSCINGDTADMQQCLNEIICYVKSFEDSLTASGLLTKLLAASSKYSEAIENCLSVLSTLGEDFPQDVDLSFVLNEFSVIQATLVDITVEKVKILPKMMDKSKLHAMRFMSMLCSFAIISKPFLVPILACRMIRLTIEDGFCDDSIVGLVTVGYGLCFYGSWKHSISDDIRLGYRIGKVGEALMEESPNRHALRSRLNHEMYGSLKSLVEPFQSAVNCFPDVYNSAMLAGDIGNAMFSLLGHCIGSLHGGLELASITRMFEKCIKQMIMYQQHNLIYLSMSSVGLIIFLTGERPQEVDVKSYSELNQIGESSHDLRMLHQNFINEMAGHFWMREYAKVVELCTKYKSPGPKRPLTVFRNFFEGISCFALARQTHQPSWRKIGEEALEKMLKWETISKWNFEQLAALLQAESHYLNGNLKLAELSYKSSIISAQNHKFFQYEALASELYGIFCLETQAVDKGVDQLHLALAKYKKWGAKRKVKDLQEFIDLVNPETLRKELKIDI